MNDALLRVVASQRVLRPVLLELRSARRQQAFYMAVAACYLLPSAMADPGAWWRWVFLGLLAVCAVTVIYSSIRITRAIEGSA